MGGLAIHRKILYILASQMKKVNDYTLIVNTGDETFEIEFDRTLRSYNIIAILDLKKHNLVRFSFLLLK